MTEDEIIEGNKLIAEFMDNSMNDINDFSKPDDGMLCFDWCWDWLMPVIDKIESLKYMSVYISKTYLSKKHRVEISHETPNYQKSQNNKTVFVESDNKIECVFSACVEFIIWYNNNKNKINK